MNAVRDYAVKSATRRKAGTVQKECLVIHLDGKSFGSASKKSKLDEAMMVISHVGISKKGHYVFEFEGKLWIRYPRYELTGKESLWYRNAEDRRRALSMATFSMRDSKTGRVGGYVHLWSGDIAWGGSGKFALKPFEGQFRQRFTR